MNEPALFDDYRDMLSELAASGAEYLLVGSHAMSVHGVSRYTQDLDLFIRPTAENASSVWAAVARFGAPMDKFTINDFARPNWVMQIGVPPIRIDLITTISGVTFDEAWAGRIEIEIDGLRIPVIGLDDLIRNKRSTGRKKDDADVERLERKRRKGK